MDLNRRIGTNLRAIRKQRGLSLDQTSEQTGVSKPMLGQIERGISNPTVSTLWKIATGLGMAFSSFVESKQPEIKLVKKAELQPLAEDDGRYLVYPLFPLEERAPFEIFYIQLEPGCHYVSKPHPDGVAEYIWVESGQLTVAMDEQQYEVQEEEGIRFAANCAHTYHNDEQHPCEALLLIHYPR